MKPEMKLLSRAINMTAFYFQGGTSFLRRTYHLLVQTFEFLFIADPLLGTHELFHEGIGRRLTSQEVPK